MLGVVWAIMGVSALLLNAIVRLAGRGWEALQMDLSAVQWVVLVVFALFMMVAEGYRGFQKKISPAWILTIMIIVLIIAVSFLAQPWRGIVDVGVVLGLSWGLISFWIFCVKALTKVEFSHSPEMP